MIGLFGGRVPFGIGVVPHEAHFLSSIWGSRIELGENWAVPAQPFIGCLATAPARETEVHSLLDEAPVYNTISYCWGQNPPPKRVVVDGVAIEVPESAAVALRNTYRTKEDLQTPVWIDTISINQQDLKEKG